MRKPPIIMLLTFGLFLGLQAHSACRCVMEAPRHESTCCHSERAHADAPDIKSACCGRCSLDASDRIVLRDGAATILPLQVFLAPHKVVLTLNEVVTAIPREEILFSAVIIHHAQQPRAPPAA